jgi:ankyrin repeat protein
MKHINNTIFTIITLISVPAIMLASTEETEIKPLTIFDAVEDSQYTLLSQMFFFNANPNEKDTTGRTLVAQAVQNGNLDMVEFLLEKKS